MRIVIVKCVSCGKCREIYEDSVAYGDFPVCDECFNPMIGEKVYFKEGKEIVKEEWIYQIATKCIY